jgi:hypothetical protein
MQCQIWNLQINKQLNIKKVSTAVDKAVDTVILQKSYTQLINKGWITFIIFLKFQSIVCIKFLSCFCKCLNFHLIQ